MGAFLLGVWFIGFFVTWAVVYSKTGFGALKREEDVDWREFLFSSPYWFVLTVAKVWFWPVTVVVWLATGRPQTRWRAVTSLNGRQVRRIVRVSSGEVAK